MDLKHFGQFLLEKNVIDTKQLLDTLEFQRNKNFSFGEVALKTGLINTKQYENILKNQLSRNISFVDSAIELEYITLAQKDEVFRKEISNNLLFGEVLVFKKFLTQDAVDDYYKEFRSFQNIIEFKILDQIQRCEFHDTVDVIIQSALNLFQYLLNVTPRIQGFYSDDETPHDFDWVVIQKIFGDVNVIVQLLVSDDLLCPISSSLLRMEVDELSELVLDSAKEFLTILTGFVCSSLSLSNIKCDIEVPMIINIDDLKQLPMQFRIPFFFSSGSFEIRLLFDDDVSTGSNIEQDI